MEPTEGANMYGQVTPYAALEAAILGTGIWDEGRRYGPHGFQVSPQCCVITPDQRTELDHLSRAVYRSLLGMSRIMAIGADSSLHGMTDVYNRLYRMMGRGAPYNFSNVKPSNIPLLCKTDLVVGADGRFWIAETDATNPRSWGYSVLGRRIVQTIYPDGPQLPGVIPYLAQHLVRQQVPALTFLYGHTQRFYAPEFRIVAAELAAYGINMAVLDEVEVAGGGGEPFHAYGQFLPPWLVDLPPMNQNKPLIDGLAAAYRQREAQFIIPPKHFLASKTVLAVLANSDGDPEIEGVLRSQITAADLELVRHYLPPSYLVRKGMTKVRQLGGGAYVLKKGFASGMKGVWFSDDPGFAGALKTAGQQDGGYILQEEVPQLPHQWAVYAPDGQLRVSDGWFLRLTGYFSRDGVQDLAVTVRQDKRVHGSTDAVLTGTVIG